MSEPGTPVFQRSVEINSVKWVLKELQPMLKDVQRQLETCAEQAEGFSALQPSVDALRQVRGTLQMVELYGAAQLAGEMQRAAEALIEQRVESAERALETLLRTALQLPDYLERLQAGSRDVPLVLLPLLNELREARRAAPLTERELFFPDLSVAPELEHEPQGPLKEIAVKQRRRYQHYLLEWLRKPTPQVLASIDRVLAALEQASVEIPSRRVWYIARAVVATALAGALSNDSLKPLLAQVDRLLRVLVAEGERRFQAAVSLDFLKGMLYLIARTDVDDKRVNEVRATYQLAKLLPSEEQIALAKQTLAGPNLELLAVVNSSIKEDISQIKDAVEIYVHGGDKRREQLRPLQELFGRVVDTVHMLGIDKAQRLLREHAGEVAEIVKAEGEVAEERLMSLAGVLLSVEETLDDFVSQRADLMGSVPLVPQSRERLAIAALPGPEFQALLSAVIREALGDFARARENMLAYLAEPERVDHIRAVPALLDEVNGAMFMLPLDKVVPLLQDLSRYVREVVVENGVYPDERRQNLLADVVASIEYYLEAVEQGRGDMTHILARGERALGELRRVEPRAGPTTGLNAVVDTVTPEQESEPEAQPRVEVEPVAAKPVPPEPPSIDGFPVIGEDVDNEILEVFLEEALSELQEISQHLPQWQADTSNEASLVRIRRAFHTLKGSGRVIGAELIGEYAWSMENLLNQVIAGRVSSLDPVFELLEEAVGVLPQLIEQLSGNPEPVRNVMDVVARGHRLANPAAVEEEEPPAPLRPVPVPAPAEPAPAPERVTLESPEDSREVLDNFEVTEDDELEPVTLESPEDSREVLDNFEVTEDDELEPVTLESSEDSRELLDDFEQVILESPEESGDVLHFTLEEDEAREPPAPGAVPPTGEPHDPSGLPAQPTPALPVDEAAGEAVDEYGFDAVPGVAPEPAQRAADQAAAEKAAAEKAAAEKAAAEKAAAEQAAAEQAAAEQAAAEQAAAEQAAAEKAAAEQAAAEQAAAEQAAAEQAAAEKAAAEQAAAEHAAAEQAAAEKAAGLGMPGFDDLGLEGAAPIPSTDQQSADVLPYARPDGATLLPEPPAADEAFAPSVAARADGSGEDAGQPAIDPVLLDIFVREARGHITDLRKLVTSALEHDRELMPREELIRGLHTLHGSAQTAEVREIAVLSAILEKVAKAKQHLGVPFDRAEVTLLAESLGGLSEALDWFTGSGERPEDLEALEAQALSLERKLEGQSDAIEQDDELIGIFIEEGDELLENADRLLGQWRQRPRDPAVIADLQRQLHTLKGGARMANFVPIADLSHALETLVVSITERAAPPEPATFELVHEAVDALTVMLEQARNGQNVSRVDWLLDELTNLRDNPDAVPGAAAAAARASGEEEVREQPAAEESAAAAAGALEQVRVNADLLDNLVNYAGEVNIYQSRLGQQVSDYRFNLEELDQTVFRLRDQLRKMEMETEAQILYRFEKEEGEPATEEFDPLELDRYSQIQELSRALMESVEDLESIKGILGDITRDSESLLQQQTRLSADLQDGLMRTRMVRFDRLSARLARVIRQTATSLGRKAELEVRGGATEIDRTVQERIVAPLEHMLRNAVSHGIEAPAQRRRLGKPETGRITIDLQRDGTDVLITVVDDGAGINLGKVREKAIARGLLAEDVQASGEDVVQLILETGMSTAEEVTQISGRGVGMDVVASEIKQLGGTISIATDEGAGTRFSIRLPLTLAINQALLVDVAGEIYALPLAGIVGVSQVSAAELQRYYVDRGRKYHYAGFDYELHHLGSLLDIGSPRLNDQEHVWPLIMLRSGDHRVAMHVEALVGRREVVVKPVGPQISTLRGISGATILPDGRVVLILDPASLLRALSTVQAAAEEEALPEAEPQAGITVMVVDDSITIRKVTQRMLERHEINVTTAKDGVDAVTMLADHVPDLILLDIEMPRMDGYEVAAYVRNNERLRDVPIIMITSRTGDKHRRRARELGVNEYLGKPYQEHELLSHINQILTVQA